MQLLITHALPDVPHYSPDVGRTTGQAGRRRNPDITEDELDVTQLADWQPA